MNERFIQLRKLLGLTQTEIGERLGSSRNVIANLELGRVDFTEMMIRHICRTFSVSQAWFRSGEGDIFTESGDSFSAEMKEKYQLTDYQMALVRGVYEMPPELQRMAVEVARKIAAESYLNAEMTDIEHEHIERIANDYLDAYDAQNPGEQTDKQA